MKTWGDIFRAALRRGDDHGYAAYLADGYVKRRNMKIFDQLRKVMELEQEAHRLFDDSNSNLAYGRLSAEKRDEYVQQTYRATRLHHEAMETLRALAKDLNAIMDTGYSLD